MINDFKLIQDMVKCLSGVSISKIRGTDEEIIKLLEDSPYRGMRSVNMERAIIRAFRNMRPDCIYELKGILNVSYLAIFSAVEENYLVIGPCVTEMASEAEAKSQLHRLGLTPEHIQTIVEFTKQQAVLPYETLHQLGAMLANHLNGIPRPVPYQQIDYRWDFESRTDIQLVDHYEDLDRMRQVERRYEVSTVLTEAVKQGNLSLAYQMIRQMRPDVGKIIRNSNPLRNSQNLCIVLNTQLRHAMEETGIHPYTLDRFSDEIARQIERISSTRETEKYMMEIIRQYCERARNNTYPDVKPFTRLAITYIKEHLSDNLTVKETARSLMVNANYLSDQFHKDTGMTFIDFVNRERVEQAASLLKHTNLQVQQIAALVGYNNTSYFAKQFMRFYRMTPRSFRNSGLF